MTLLAMMRHAQTDWSAEGRIQGRTDIPLNEAGRRALLVCSLPEEFRQMRVVTSPLRRCVETADQLGLPAYTRESRLAEMAWGTWEGRRLVDLRAELGAVMQENEARGMDFCPPGGESPRTVLARVTGWLAEVAVAGEPTLAISHRGVIRVVYAAATGWDMRGRPGVKLDWSALHVFRLGSDGSPVVHRLNQLLARPSSEVGSGTGTGT